MEDDHGLRKCWGSDHRGRLGIGPRVEDLEPVRVEGPVDVTAVSADDWHTFVRRSVGTA